MSFELITLVCYKCSRFFCIKETINWHL
uniref:Uncharacterized protein n=1 Tax=Arundo donax TaxID=35708 RepID=A0A0A9FCI4_ARUDO